MRSFLYLTRLPPSPSGVALYAEMFTQVLRLTGELEVLRLPARPEDSQTIHATRTVLRSLRQARRRTPQAILVAELAGRGVAEFWGAWWVARRGGRVIVTLHDAPSVSGGGPFYIRLLDRRGGRRLAARLSGGLGRRAERSLLSRALAVITLSEVGARAVERSYDLDRAVVVLPHVMTGADAGRVDDLDAESDDHPGLARRRMIYVPGHVSAAGDAGPALSLLAEAGGDWSVVVGACTPETEDAIREVARGLGVDDRVVMAGYTDEASLDGEFGQAAVVLRWREAGFATPGAPGSSAVSGPLVRAMAHGCAIVTNDNRGSGRCLLEAGARVVDDRRQTAQALAELVEDDQQRVRLGRQALAHVRKEHRPSAVARELAQILDSVVR